MDTLDILTILIILLLIAGISAGIYYYKDTLFKEEEESSDTDSLVSDELSEEDEPIIECDNHDQQWWNSTHNISIQRPLPDGPAKLTTTHVGVVTPVEGYYGNPVVTCGSNGTFTVTGVSDMPVRCKNLTSDEWNALGINVITRNMSTDYNNMSDPSELEYVDIYTEGGFYNTRVEEGLQPSILCDEEGGDFRVEGVSNEVALCIPLTFQAFKDAGIWLSDQQQTDYNSLINDDNKIPLLELQNFLITNQDELLLIGVYISGDISVSYDPVTENIELQNIFPCMNIADISTDATIMCTKGPTTHNISDCDSTVSITILADDINDTDLYIYTTGHTHLPEAGFIVIDSEIIEYTRRNSYIFVTQRGFRSTASAHVRGTPINLTYPVPKVVEGESNTEQFTGCVDMIPPYFPDSGYIRINDEIMQYSGIQDTDTQQCPIAFILSESGAEGTYHSIENPHPVDSLVYMHPMIHPPPGYLENGCADGYIKCPGRMATSNPPCVNRMGTDNKPSPNSDMCIQGSLCVNRERYYDEYEGGTLVSCYNKENLFDIDSNDESYDSCDVIQQTALDRDQAVDLSSSLYLWLGVPRASLDPNEFGVPGVPGLNGYPQSLAGINTQCDSTTNNCWNRMSAWFAAGETDDRCMWDCSNESGNNCPNTIP